jgi:hypothetical protein
MNSLRLLVATALALLLAPSSHLQTMSLVELDARDFRPGSEWTSRGTLGPFTAVGGPRLATINGFAAVALDGKADAFVGPNAPDSLTGGAPRTIEVWAYNPSIDSDEETLVSWGRRGGAAGSLIAFGWGRNPAYGAMAHWAADLGWNGTPPPNQWHYLVYAYDGKTARVFDDGVEKQAREIRLRTGSTPIVIGAQTGPSGRIQFTNEYTQRQQAGSLAIANVRIRSGAMSQAQIDAAFAAEAPRFGARREDVEGFAAKGRDSRTAGGFDLTVLRATGTAASLSPAGSRFDFLPGDRLMGRAADGYYHLGDCTLRARSADGDWKSFTSAANHLKARPVALPGALQASDITATFGASCPLDVRREWTAANGRLALRFHVRNPGAQPVELGAFGAAMVFNNLITGRSLDETHDRCSFADPYIGMDAGYLQVTRLNGQGPALLVIPERGTSFEAYRPLWDDPTPREVTFEGFYEWMVHTRAYADRDWKNAQPWNQPTSRVLKPGEEAVYGFRFVLAPSIKQIEQTLIAERRPVAVGVPGYVLPTDTTGRLFLHSASPVRSVACEPAQAVSVKADQRPTQHGWRGFTIRGMKTGRSRLTVTYADGLRQAIHTFVIPPETEQLRKLGEFHAKRQWFTDPNDPFGRTDSFLPFNRETNAMVLQHSHSWFVGLSDEIGAGASVAMAMKNLAQPNAAEIALLEKYANHTLWGHVQNPDYSVRASLFYYDPKLHPGYYTIRGGWDKARTETTWRSFNYPHVTAVYWALYRLARDHEGLVKTQPWSWYLDHAYRTIMAIKQFAPGYAEVGLMVGSVFPEVIRDLRREGWNDKADEVEAYMRQRESRWVKLRYPFGSEMPWDSTGQEEIYTWCRYFGADDKARVTVDAVLGYMPTVPNWAYNGAARRYFDAPVNGNRWPHIIRTTNHYGPAINAIPVLDDYRRSPDDFYLLRVGYAGMDQVLANIDSEGFASYGFDCDPAILKFDPYTADYGIAFYGYSRCAGAYAMKHPEFGWLGFGCEVTATGKTIRITPRDGIRKRMFIAPISAWLTLDAGRFKHVEYDPESGTVRIALEPATDATRAAYLRVESTTARPALKPARRLEQARGAYVIPLSSTTTQVGLNPR